MNKKTLNQLSKAFRAMQNAKSTLIEVVTTAVKELTDNGSNYIKMGNVWVDRYNTNLCELHFENDCVNAVGVRVESIKTNGYTNNMPPKIELALDKLNEQNLLDIAQIFILGGENYKVFKVLKG